MFTVWAHSLTTAQAIKQIKQCADHLLDHPFDLPKRFKYRALARELNTRGHNYPTYPSNEELAAIVKGY